MPDSLQNISIDPAALQIEAELRASMTAHEDEILSDIVNGKTGHTFSSAPADGLKAREDSIVARPRPKTALIITAHKEPEMPVSPRSVGNAATSWVILGLIAVFMLVSLRYARNFKFLSGIGRELLSKQPRRRMFDDTVRETSFLIFLNILCMVSVGVLLFGGIETFFPVLRNSDRWYSALGLVIAAVSIYYIWQWGAYFVLGRTFGTREDASSWMRGFSSGQGFLGLALFLPALISIFYSGSLNVLIVLSAIAYVLVRILFIVKGIRIFLPRSRSWMLFFYYLCAVEIAPVALLIRLSTRLCLSVISV